MSGQGNGSSSSSSMIQVPSNQSVNYQPMDCGGESSPRQNKNRRQLSSQSYQQPSSSLNEQQLNQQIDNNSSRIQSSLGSYNSLILPGMAHLPAMITSPIIQQQNYYNYGYQSGDTHGGRQQQTTNVKQRDNEREDSPMVGVCVQQSPVAIH